ncbi:MAG: hypothetical protein PHP53_15270 [Prolixibacteraceae bacterium]|nr:hypothetical protein [Prolixibacteraceae bacterium]
MGYLEGFGLGIIGGMIPELVAMYQIRKEYNSTKFSYLTTFIYWAPTLVMILAGGGLVDLYLLGGSTINPLLAVNLGASAPFILGNMTKHAPKTN